MLLPVAVTQPRAYFRWLKPPSHCETALRLLAHAGGLRLVQGDFQSPSTSPAAVLLPVAVTQPRAYFRRLKPPSTSKAGLRRLVLLNCFPAYNQLLGSMVLFLVLNILLNHIYLSWID